MNEQRLRRSSWILLGAALCAQATSWFQHYDAMRIMIAVSAVLVAAGIYAHLRSKGYQPLKQWELYVYAILLYEIWFAAILITLLAMWRLSWISQALETSPRSAGNETSGTTDSIENSAVPPKSSGQNESAVPVVVGGIAGLAAGFAAMIQESKGLGDSPGAGMGLLCMAAYVPDSGISSGRSSSGRARSRPWREAMASGAWKDASHAE